MKKLVDSKVLSDLIRAEKGNIGDTAMSYFLDLIDDAPAADVAPVERWISVKERLPEDGETVLIYCGGVHTAKIRKGISKSERTQMENGKLENPIEIGYTFSDGECVEIKTPRSKCYRACDEDGNNRVPYCWYGDGPMKWFGQEITHWMPFPEPPQ